MLFLVLKKERLEISIVSLLYCHCHFVLSAKRSFSTGIWKKCPLLGGVR